MRHKADPDPGELAVLFAFVVGLGFTAMLLLTLLVLVSVVGA